MDSYYHEGFNRRTEDPINSRLNYGYAVVRSAIVDLAVHNNIASNVQLTKSERRELSHVLYNACIIDGVKMNVMSAIDIMVESLKRIILDNSKEKLKLPMILPIESMEGITE